LGSGGAEKRGGRKEERYREDGEVGEE